MTRCRLLPRTASNPYPHSPTLKPQLSSYPPRINRSHPTKPNQSASHALKKHPIFPIKKTHLLFPPPLPSNPSTSANSHSTHSSPTHPSAPTGSNNHPLRPSPSQTRTARRLRSHPCSARSRRLCRRRFGPRRGLLLSGEERVDVSCEEFDGGDWLID